MRARKDDGTKWVLSCLHASKWAKCRDEVLRLAAQFDDAALWEMVQIVGGAFQQQHNIAFLAMPRGEREAMLAWLRALGT